MKANNIILTVLHLILCVLYGGLWIAFSTSMFPSMVMAKNVLLFVFVPHCLAAIWAYQGKPMGRTLSKVMGTILLLGIPIGTVLGIAILSQTGKRWVATDQNS